MRQILKKTLRLFIILSVIALILTGGLLMVSKYYGDEIEQSLVGELNRHLNIEVSVDDITFSALENFPFASVTFSRVATGEDARSGNGPLLRAEEVSVLFNLMDLITKNYTINRVQVKNGFVNLVIAEDGTRNFDIFRKNSKDNESQFRINLQSVIFKNIGVSYIHYPSDQEYLFTIEQGNLSGEFSSASLQLGFKGDVYSSHIRSGKTTFLSDRQLGLDFHLENREQDHTLTISEADIETDGMLFGLEGEIQTGNSNRSMALNVKAKQSKLSALMKLVPPEYLVPLRDYNIDGTCVFEAAINGPFNGDQLPGIEFNFSLVDGRLKHPKSGFYMEEVSFQGNFSNGSRRSASSFGLHLKNISALIRGGNVAGNLNITDFNQPLIQADLSSRFDLKELKHLYSNEQIESISGELVLDMSFTNRLKSFRKFTINDFISSRTAGDMKFTDLSFNLKNNNLQFNNFQGAFRFSNKDLIIDNFTGKVSDSDFEMDGYFGNILAFTFVRNEPVYINADIQSRNLNLDQLLAYSATTPDSPYRLTFSHKVSFDLDVNIDDFVFRKFDGHSIRGGFSMVNQKFYVKDGSLKAMDGTVKLDGVINGTDPDRYHIDCDARFSDVDIRELFREFGDFGQENLTSNHLRGRVTADVQYKSTLSPALFVDPASVYTFADITVDDGELIGYEPLYALSRFIKQEELEHVKFSTLTNNIKIENRIIYIPRMEIRSSTMDISLYGNHTFDNITDYHVQLYLADLIRNGRAPKTEEEIDGIFVKDEENGRPKLFLSMTGPADNPDINYDTREVKKKIASDLSREKEEFREVIRKEFSWLNKNKKEEKTPTDTILKPGERDFAIGWDEVKKDSIKSKENREPKKQQGGKTQKNKEKEFIIHWDETKDTIR